MNGKEKTVLYHALRQSINFLKSTGVTAQIGRTKNVKIFTLMLMSVGEHVPPGKHGARNRVCELYRDPEFTTLRAGGPFRVRRNLSQWKGREPKSEELKRRDAILSKMGYASYHGYLRGDRWKAIKGKVDGDCCEECNGPIECYHHSEYTRENLSGETTEGIHPLCNDCHYAIHFSYGTWKLF